ncbi:MAG: hypothetical protein HJJLKODD_02868 [Phycisphaerae bacterium]|nr:hypothetical protein [Phycisphaerae bacterium]
MRGLGKYGRTALVTGASSGIGAAYARELARQGLNLVLVARRAAQLNQLQEELQRQHAVRVWPIVQDLSVAQAGALVENQVRAEGLEIDILINNAGFGVYGEFSSTPRERDLQMVDLNCRAVVDLTHRFLPPMKTRRRGAIIIISSALGFLPAPFHTVYCATKAFDLFFGECLYAECKPYGIDVLAMCPTLTATEFQSVAGSIHSPVTARQAEDVVHTSLRALGRKASGVDGWSTRWGLLLTRLLTRTQLVNMAYRFMNQRAAHEADRK